MEAQTHIATEEPLCSSPKELPVQGRVRDKSTSSGGVILFERIHTMRLCLPKARAAMTGHEERLRWNVIGRTRAGPILQMDLDTHTLSHTYMHALEGLVKNTIRDSERRARPFQDAAF